MTTITGYRNLTQGEIERINDIKQLGIVCGELVSALREFPQIDQRWVSIGATDLQTGLMALTRAIAQPETF